MRNTRQTSYLATERNFFQIIHLARKIQISQHKLIQIQNIKQKQKERNSSNDNNDSSSK